MSNIAPCILPIFAKKLLWKKVEKILYFIVKLCLKKGKVNAIKGLSCG